MAPLFTVAASLLVCVTAVTGTILPKAVSPVVAKTTDYGDLIDPGLNRDSCTSTLWSDNVLWVCRDTQQVLSNGSIGHQLVANTASFSSLPSSRSHHQQLLLSSPEPYGTLFYPFQQDECPASGCGDNVCGPGICGPGSRWVGWPDTTPLVVARGPPGTGWVDAYGWMAKQRLDGLTVLNATGNVLFRVTSRVSGEKELPTTTFVDTFWSPTEIGYGTAAHVIHEGFAYLYGGTLNAELAVARVNLAGGSFENRKSYEFYVNGTWTRKTPLFTDPGAILPNTSAKQGTVYWSPKWKSFVWIGGDGFPDANGLISTAPKAEGPWSTPIQFYSGSIGNGTLPAYSLVAHPGLTDGTGDYIFISWTKTRPDPATGFAVYTQPLVRVDWK
ncbi:hypothetical protein B0H14DRAFT_2790199 [Mycena olivaceomarginata]|nr:hypothetical protein B0H14DRAFT_2790199 [Mycena olivaceomarginata]